MNEIVSGLSVALRHAGLLLLLTLCTAACADSSCDAPADMTRVISPSSARLPPDRFAAVTAEMTLEQIIGVLGPAVRDIGSGLHLLEWQSTDGRVFRVSGPSFCERPMNFGFVARVSTLIDAEAKQAVLAAEREWAMAAKQQDLERSVSFMADDAVMFPPGSAAIVGKSAIREYMAAGFATPGFSVTWEPEEVVVADGGDFAYTRSRSRYTLPGPDGQTQTVHAKGVAIWRKSADGQWRCVVDIWNDAPPADSVVQKP